MTDDEEQLCVWERTVWSTNRTHVSLLSYLESHDTAMFPLSLQRRINLNFLWDVSRLSPPLIELTDWCLVFECHLNVFMMNVSSSCLWVSGWDWKLKCGPASLRRGFVLLMLCVCQDLLPWWRVWSALLQFMRGHSRTVDLHSEILHVKTWTHLWLNEFKQTEAFSANLTIL